MISRRQEVTARKLHRNASVFAALGDTTRLTLVATLGDGVPRSITELTEGTNISRQAITKHLRVLEDAGLVKSTTVGRQNIFAFEPRTLIRASQSLDLIAQQWDAALQRLKEFVEE
jgi:DNA-binding transcriptional ArsR family regulator